MIALVGATEKSTWSRMIVSRFEDARTWRTSMCPRPRCPTPCETQPPPGIRHAVALSSGFSEAGEAGARLQAELLDIANERAVLMMGPNSMGLRKHRPEVRLHCTPDSPPTPHRQIGYRVAVANELGKFAHAQGIGLSFIGSTGNEARSALRTCSTYLVDDPDTGASAVYVESVKDASRFIAAASRARDARKPLVVLKVGRGEISGAVAQAHTGALVGDDRVFDAVCAPPLMAAGMSMSWASASLGRRVCCCRDG